MHDVADRRRWSRFYPKLKRVKPNLRRIRVRTLGSLVRRFVSRGYALTLMVILLWAGGRAFAYLLQTVFKPAQVSQQILDWQEPTNVAALRGWRQNSRQEESTRAPIAHFHDVVRPFQPDQNNGCTIAGCHQPLPHGEKMKVPAFANFHVAFLDCKACHSNISDRPTSFAWMSLKTSAQQPPPAMLRLSAFLHEKREAIQEQPAGTQKELLDLVAQIQQIREDDRFLSSVRDQLESTEPGSPLWNTALQRLSTQLPTYARGSYGAKLIPLHALNNYDRQHQQLLSQAQEYFAAAPNSAQQNAIDDKIHAGINKHPAGCMLCHTDANSLLDFESVGYLPDRAKSLRDLQLARLMEDIRHGKQFRLPTLVEDPDAK